MQTRHKIELFILFWLVFIALSARIDYYVYWIVLCIFWGIPCLFDWLFLGQNEFLFEPNFKNWQKANE
jgi:hypothetical protein